MALLKVKTETMTKHVFIALLCTLTSCNILSEMGPQAKVSITINDVQKEQIDSIKVQDITHTFRLVAKGQLSDSVKIVWSESKDSLYSPTILTYNSEILKKGKVNLEFRRDYYSKVLYFRYLPFNPNTQGNLKAELMLF